MDNDGGAYIIIRDNQERFAYFCNACHEMLSKNDFSKNQLNKNQQLRRCRTCIKVCRRRRRRLHCLEVVVIEW